MKKKSKIEPVMSQSPPDEIMQEYFEAYHTYAQELNLRTEPDPAAIPFMDGMSDALVWPDECPEDAPMELISALRFVWNYRTSLLLETIPQFEENWKIAKECFPSWVGFRPERTSPSPELLQAIREGKQSLNNTFDEMLAEKERKADEMNRCDMEEIQDSNTDTPHPLEVMQNAYQRMEIEFEVNDGSILADLNLENLQVHVISYGEPDDLAVIIVKIPIRAAPKFRAAAGEFLHRLNFGARRKYWEIDHNDGEIRMAAYIDTIAGPLTELNFRALLHSMLMTGNEVFPFMTNVLSGSMTPEFAADQAEAAIIAMCNGDRKADEA
jgi:hypothetical protein